jgi:hypothetical protein
MDQIPLIPSLVELDYLLPNLLRRKTYPCSICSSRLSDPRKVDAAQAENNCDTDSPESSILLLVLLCQHSIILCVTAGIGSCQISSSLGTSLPR